MFSNNIDDEYGVKSGYAGRSGGWLEVAYDNNLMSLENDTVEDVNELYKEANKLEKLETEVSQFIEKSLSSYKKYINSDEYVKDIAEMLTTDEDIGDIYKGKAKDLLDKLQ